jgi:transposase
VKQIPAPRTIYMEEGTLAAWLLETCVSYGEKLVITDPKQNSWIGASGQKNDPLDAKKLAQLARGGYITEVHHPVGDRRRFKELMLAYHDTVKNVTRIKNKIKAKFRQNGIKCTGETVYAPTQRQEWLRKLPAEASLQLILKGLWQQLEQAEQSQTEILSAAQALSKNYSEIKVFDAIPGIGFVHAATVSAIIETPHRFADKRKVWMYAGLGILARSSGDKLYSERLTKEYNRLLKYTLKQAVEAAIQAADNPFRRKYLEMTLVRGIAPHRAKLTIARNLLSTMLAIWKKGEEYNPEIRKRETFKQV